MHYSIDPEIFALHPGFTRVVLIAEDICNNAENPELATILKAEVKETYGRLGEDFKNHPRLLSWAEIFKGMGLNPNRFPPSVLNLVKRACTGKVLPYINNLVASFNLISLRHLCPCGGDDLDMVKGDLLLTRAKGDEFYVPLGQPDIMEHPPAGEIVYMDTGGREVFCRAWCWKNSDRSKLLSSTSRAAINIDLMPPMREQDAPGMADELCGLLKKYAGASCRIFILNAAKTRFEF